MALFISPKTELQSISLWRLIWAITIFGIILLFILTIFLFVQIQLKTKLYQALEEELHTYNIQDIQQREENLLTLEFQIKEMINFLQQRILITEIYRIIDTNLLPEVSLTELQFLSSKKLLKLSIETPNYLILTRQIEKLENSPQIRFVEVQEIRKINDNLLRANLTFYPEL